MQTSTTTKQICSFSPNKTYISPRNIKLDKYHQFFHSNLKVILVSPCLKRPQALRAWWTGSWLHCICTCLRQLRSMKNAVKNAALSKYIWDLKDNHCAYSINWSILNHAKPCNNCNLCPTEKLCILNADKRYILNKRS